MLSQESPAQLHFKDLSTALNYPCLQHPGQPSPEPSLTLNDRPPMTISSIVNPVSGPVISGEYNSTSAFGQTLAHTADPQALWPAFTEFSDYLTSQNYQTAQPPLTPDCESNMAYYFNGSSTEGASSAYDFPYDFTMSGMSPSLPRSYRSGFDRDLTEQLVLPYDACSPSSYFMDPQKHQPYMTTSSCPIQGFTLHTKSEDNAVNILQLDYSPKNEFYSCPSPAPSRLSSHYDAAEHQASPGAGRDRESEEVGNIIITSDDPDEDEDDGNLPYAQLIYKALMSVPEKRMVLSEIYDWFRKTYEKFRTMKTKGWQNSIRHNLSMNAAFRKVEKTDDSSKGYIWVLEPFAIREGVKSTTRYRKVTAGKKNLKSENQNPQRQSPARRGIKPAKKNLRSTKSGRTERAAAAAGATTELLSADIDLPTAILGPALPHLPPSLPNEQSTWPYYDSLSVVLSPQDIEQEQPYLFQDTVGVSATYCDEPFFYDTPGDGGVHTEYPSHDPIANPFYIHHEI